MNSKKSAVFFAIAIVIFVGVFLGFIHGVQLEETGPKVGWIAGSLAVGALTVFLSYQTFMKK